MRASLLAKATASLFRCNRSEAELSHGPKLYRAQLYGRIRRTFAAWISSVRRYLLPRLEMRPRIDRPPVLYCRGTSPSQAAKSRPRSKASPLPIAATMAVEISGPTLGTLINWRHLASDRLRISISPVTVSIRSSRQHQSSWRPRISVAVRGEISSSRLSSIAKSELRRALEMPVAFRHLLLSPP